MDNFANIGKAVLLQTIGLQHNFKEVKEEIIEVTNYNNQRCLNCKSYSMISNFDAASELYKNAISSCNNCPYRTTTTERKLSTIYHNEKNRYGYRPMLKSGAIKLMLLLHFYHPDKFGVISQVDPKELAAILNCTSRSITNNLALLKEYGYIEYTKHLYNSYSICILNYESYYLPANKGGRGFIVMSKELLFKLCKTHNLNSLRIHIRQLIELDNLSVKADFSAITVSFKDIKRTLPAYCKPGIIKNSISLDNDIFNISYTSTSIRFEIIDCFNSRRQKSECLNNYSKLLEEFIIDFNKNVVSINTSNNYDHMYDSFFTQENIPVNISNYLMIKLKADEVADIARLALSYSFDHVIQAFSIIYKTYILKEIPINNIAGLVRSIINSFTSHSSPVQVA